MTSPFAYMNLRAWALGAAIIAAGSVVAGCAALNLNEDFAWWGSKTEKIDAARIEISWIQTTRTQSEKVVQRGFSGEVVFFPKDVAINARDSTKKAANAKGTLRAKAMKVDGTLTVYVFDESTSGKLSPARPRIFVFPPEQLKKLCSDSKLGYLYEVWLPWDTAGGPPKQLRLMARFDPIDKGPALISPDTHHLLASNPSESRIARSPSSTFASGTSAAASDAK